METSRRLQFEDDLVAAQREVQQGVSLQRANAASGHWETWAAFCAQLAFDPFLANIEDPVNILQVFAKKYRTGKLAPRGKNVRSRTVEDALRSVGQTFSGVGTSDPRLNASGDIDFRLQRQLSCYKKQDPPPNRVKPVPIQVIRRLVNVTYASES